MKTIEKKALLLDDKETLILATLMLAETIENKDKEIIDKIGLSRVAKLIEQVEELDDDIQEMSPDEQSDYFVSLLNKVLTNLNI